MNRELLTLQKNKPALLTGVSHDIVITAGSVSSVDVVAVVAVADSVELPLDAKAAVARTSGSACSPSRTAAPRTPAAATTAASELLVSPASPVVEIEGVSAAVFAVAEAFVAVAEVARTSSPARASGFLAMRKQTGLLYSTRLK